ncbi:MAG TPA: aldehyde dehydrogenase family protein [Anaerolineaceae bacterium]|nr:aldehyde dehydrogenase family protein [Anaerolineaceae bacterium]
MAFKLTYGTMSDPPQEMHDKFDQALENVKQNLGREYPMIINGENRFAEEKHQAFSPINTNLHLATFQKGTAKDADDAVAAAKAAFPNWKAMNWEERVYLMRKFADRISARIYEISAAVSLEVGKNRMEALGDVAETEDLIRWAADMMEQNNGYRKPLGSDPLVGMSSTNESILKPYGVWVVIVPFNFPASLAGGPVGNALVAGNTVVLKPASDSSWTASLLVECAQEAGIPDGVLNLVTGSGSTLGNALTANEDVAGITFTGSLDVGMGIYRQFANRKYPHPVILELGGKNPTIVSRNADLDLAAEGVMRSAFGLQGQKCSATSRVFVEKPVYDAFVSKLVANTSAIQIGDPTEQENWFGPVINRKAYQDYGNYVAELAAAGTILTGGKQLIEGELAKGFYCAPTVVADVPLGHRLWKEEMFLPIVMVTPVDDLKQAMELANDVDYGLTAGFVGTPDETEWFFDHVEAGTVYSNRPQGTTTGAWPGFQSFGGWKGSGSAGKNGGGYYYLPLYMHEQSRTRVKRA